MGRWWSHVCEELRLDIELIFACIGCQNTTFTATNISRCIPLSPSHYITLHTSLSLTLYHTAFLSLPHTACHIFTHAPFSLSKAVRGEPAMYITYNNTVYNTPLTGTKNMSGKGEGLRGWWHKCPVCSQPWGHKTHGLHSYSYIQWHRPSCHPPRTNHYHLGFRQRGREETVMHTICASVQRYTS